MAGPLTGIKVLDLSRILAGPWATQVLADYGAQVWKIERPGTGDDTRLWGPPFLRDEAGNDTLESAYYIAANRGKKSIVVDITNSEGQAFIHALATEADIVVENYKVGGLQKYNLDYASLKALNSKLIYCSITGFGQTGPYSHKAGYDAMIQGMGGLMSVTGEPDNTPGGGPQKVGVAVADLMTGMYAVTGVLAALNHLHCTGEGQHIDIALFDTQVAWLANQGSNYLVSGEVGQRLGSAHPSIAPYQSVKVADGYMLLAVGNDRQFARCCQILGCESLVKQDNYASNAARVNNREALIQLLEQQLVTQPQSYWLTHLSAAHVPCGPINNLQQVFADPQLAARNMQFDLPHPTAGKVPQVANPVNFSKSPISYTKAPPILGEHTEEMRQHYINKSLKKMDK